MPADVYASSSVWPRAKKPRSSSFRRPRPGPTARPWKADSPFGARCPSRRSTFSTPNRATKPTRTTSHVRWTTPPASGLPAVRKAGWPISTAAPRSKQALRGVLERGGIIGGTSAGAAIMSRLMIRYGSPKAVVDAGFNLLNLAVVDQHFLRRNRQERLLGVLNEHPEMIGLGIDEGTALVVEGDHLRVMGQSEVVVCKSAGEQAPLGANAQGRRRSRPASTLTPKRPTSWCWNIAARNCPPAPPIHQITRSLGRRPAPARVPASDGGGDESPSPQIARFVILKASRLQASVRSCNSPNKVASVGGDSSPISASAGIGDGVASYSSNQPGLW